MLLEFKDGFIYVYDGYEYKEHLKLLGFWWNSEQKRWERFYDDVVVQHLKRFNPYIVNHIKKQADQTLVEELRQMYPFAMEHQLVGTALAIQNKSFLIGDEPGVGKTLQAIMYIDYLLAKGAISHGIIFCPSSIKRQWRDEFYKFLKVSPFIVEGDRQLRRLIFTQALRKTSYPVLILNYELLLREDVFNFLSSLESYALVFDEASRFKNKDSKTFKLVQALANKTEYKLALTGTPVENHLAEFWAVGFILKGFMDYKEFEEKHLIVQKVQYANTAFPVKKIIGYKNLRSFLFRIGEFYIRRKKSDIKELPALTEYVRFIELAPLQKQMEEYLKERIASAKGLNLESIITLLRVINDDPRLLLASQSEIAQAIVERFKHEIERFKANPKLDELQSIVEEHEGKKILVFTSFAKVAQLIANEFKALMITGSTDEKTRAKIIWEFKNRDSNILVSTDALTYGVSLDEADIVVHFDIPWSVGKIVQRTERIYRITTARNKWVYFFVGSGIESKVWEILQKKRTLFNQVVEGDVVDEEIKSALLRVLK